MIINEIIKGVGTQIRSIAMVFSHSWRKRDTLCYPEESVYTAPRYRGRIVLTRDPDGDERCSVQPVCGGLPGLLHLLAKIRAGRWPLVSGIFPHQFFTVHFLWHV